MIKINLLPKTINQKRAVRQTAALFGVLLVAVIAGGVTYSMNLQGQVKQKNVELEQIKAIENQTLEREKQKADLDAKTKPIKEKVDFIKGVLEYNTKFADLYSEVAKWTYEKVMYTSMTCDDGATITMQAQCRSLKDILRYWINMRQCDLFTEVLVTEVAGFVGTNSPGSGVSGPSYSGGEISGSQADLAGMSAIDTGVDRKPLAPGTGWISFKVTCKLDPKKAITAPTFAGTSSGTGQQTGAPGMPGAPPPPAPAPAPPGPGGPGGPGGTPPPGLNP